MQKQVLRPYLLMTVMDAFFTQRNVRSATILTAELLKSVPAAGRISKE